MEDTAKGIIGLTSSLKQAREDMQPLKDQLIADMKNREVKSLTVGDKEIQLIEKKTRPVLGLKKIMGLVRDQLGDSATQKLQKAMDEARQEPKVSHTIKIVDA